MRDLNVAEVGTKCDFHTGDTVAKTGQIIDTTARNRIGVPVIRLGDHIHQQCAILDRPGHRAGMGQRAERAGGPVWHFAKRGLVANNTAESRRYAYRATGIGAQADGPHAQRHGCSRATA